MFFRGKNEGWLMKVRRRGLNDDEGMRGFDLLFSCCCCCFFFGGYIQDCVIGVCVWVFWTVGWMGGGCTGIWFFILFFSLFLLYRTLVFFLFLSLVVFQVWFELVCFLSFGCLSTSRSVEKNRRFFSVFLLSCSHVRSIVS